MSKKTKRLQRSKKKAMPSLLIEEQISRAQKQLRQGDFTNVIATCQNLLKHLLRKPAWRVEVLAMMGLAYGMLQQYQKSYEIFTEALTLDPISAELWYNRGLASQYTTRVGQAVRDFERAVELAGANKGEVAQKIARELAIAREHAKEVMQEHGEGRTLDQLIEREEIFMHGMEMTRSQQWKEAEQAFKQLIDQGGCLPQYWGNLGVSLIMQERYNEAESALKRALEIDPDYTLARNNLEKLPEIRQAGGPLGLEIRDLSQVQDIRQAIAFYETNNSGAPPTLHSTLEKTGNTQTRIVAPLGKQSARYSLFLNPYKNERFALCPRCNIKIRNFKYKLVVQVDPSYTALLDKMCRYCFNCGLLIVHQDQLEEQLAGYFSMVNPEVIGNHYHIVGTLDRAQWKNRAKDRATYEEVLEQLHDFKEVVTFVKQTV